MKISFFTKIKQDYRSKGPRSNVQASFLGAGEAPDCILSFLVLCICSVRVLAGEQVCECEHTHMHLHLPSWPEQGVREQP